MKQSSTEYAESLIEKYNQLFCDNYKHQPEMIECAIKDVESTIEALSKMKLIFSDRELVLNYYTEALNHLKSKV